MFGHARDNHETLDTVNVPRTFTIAGPTDTVQEEQVGDASRGSKLEPTGPKFSCPA